ncbi:NAD-dependent epimerase/dehydratase family protein, partial [bacterium]
FAEGFDRVVHLAAQAGVRYSIDNPPAYVQANLVAFGNVLEGCRRNEVAHLVYASSSSVYGMNAKMPFSTSDRTDHPVSFYAATKRANELMAHTYSHLFRLPTTGLRFFTVYGPWGRPDMAAILFAKAIHEGRPIRVFNHGKLKRDFTYIDDIANGVVMTMDRTPEGDPGWTVETGNPAHSSAPYRIYNIGNNDPVELGRFIETLERAMGREAIKEFVDMQPGDVLATYADVSDLEREVGFRPSTPIEEGLGRFADWFKGYYGA